MKMEKILTLLQRDKVCDGRQKNHKLSPLTILLFNAEVIFILIIAVFSFSNEAHAQVAPVLGEQKIAVILVNFQDTVQPQLTKEQVRDIIFTKINNYYKENSYDKIFLSGDVYGWYQLSMNKTCSETEVRDAAIKAADPDIYFPDYSHILVIAPTEGCRPGHSSIGKITITSSSDGIFKASDILMGSSYITITNSTLLAHEIGHALGNDHANFLLCGNVSIGGSECSVEEYGDFFDIMGSSTELGHFNAPHKENLGWLDSLNIQTVSKSGTYTIEPIERKSSSLKVLKIKRSEVSYLYIEYRQPIGYDAGFASLTDTSIFDGATIHTTYGDLSRAQLIDTTPDPNNGITSSALRDPTLKLGKTFIDPPTGISITVTSKTTDSLTLEVVLGGLDTMGPAVLSTVPEMGEVISGEIEISSLVTDLSGVLYVHGCFDDYMFCPIQDYNTPYSGKFDSRRLTNGLHSFFIITRDWSGNNTTTQKIPIIVDNNTVPVISSDLISGSTISDIRKITFFISGATDITKVDFLNDDGATPFATKMAAPYEISLDTKILTNSAHTIKMKAYNSGGNFYALRIPITIDNSPLTSPTPKETDIEVPKTPTDDVVPPAPPASPPLIISFPVDAGESQIRIFDNKGKSVGKFFSYESSFLGGISAVVRDLETDGVLEIIAAPGKGREPEVRVFSKKGVLLSKFMAYAKSFRGGVNVTAGDLNGDGKQEIITSTRRGAPQVRIFGNKNGEWIPIIPSFLSFNSKMRAGVNIAAGDFNGDGMDEIAAIPKVGMSQLKIFGLSNKKMKLITPSIVVFPRSFKNGVNIATADLNGDGVDEILAAPDSNNEPRVLILGFRQRRIKVINSGFLAFSKLMKGGVDVGAVDIDNDGKDEILTSIAGRGIPVVRIFSSDWKKRLCEIHVFPNRTMNGIGVEGW